MKYFVPFLVSVIVCRSGSGYFASQGAKESVRESLREAFFQETLPEFVGQMQKLGITVEEVEQAIVGNNE